MATGNLHIARNQGVGYLYLYNQSHIGPLYLYSQRHSGNLYLNGVGSVVFIRCDSTLRFADNAIITADYAL